MTGKLTALAYQLPRQRFSARAHRTRPRAASMQMPEFAHFRMKKIAAPQVRSVIELYGASLHDRNQLIDDQVQTLVTPTSHLTLR